MTNVNRVIGSLAVCAAFAAGWMLHTGNRVYANGGTVYYQLQGLGQDGALTLYYPSEQTIYVYPGAVVGNSAVQCAFKYKLSDKPGGVVRRTPCPIQSINP